MSSRLPCALAGLVLAAAAPAQIVTTTSVGQHGITWHFDRAVPAGRYLTGDWWVAGPVTVTRVDPAPASGGARHGSMLNPRAGDAGRRVGQGYDDRIPFHAASAAVSFPLALAAGDSLVSTISRPDNRPSGIAGPYRGIESRGQLRTAAVLTCVASPPPADAFRPAYCGTKRTFLGRDLRTDRLPSLPRVATSATPQSFAPLFERVWLDHLTGWESRQLHPYENMPDYGREISLATSEAALLLSMDFSLAEKATLLLRFVQLGIDLHGLVDDGHRWWGDGGHLIGRKLPILVAGRLLDDPAMLAPGNAFSEDAQTWVGPGWTGARALFRMKSSDRHELTEPATWTPTEIGNERYRRCCTSIAWVGSALAAMTFDVVDAWDHAPFFAYVERWMTPMHPPDRAATRQVVGQTVDWFPHGFVDSRLVAECWRAWRDAFWPVGVTVRGSASRADLATAVFTSPRPGGTLELFVSNAPAAFGALVVGTPAAPTRFLGVDLLVGPILATLPIHADDHGKAVVPIALPLVRENPAAAGTFAVQPLWLDPSAGGSADAGRAFDLVIR